MEGNMVTTPASAAPGAPEAQRPINHFGRMFGVLFSPRATFGEIAQRPSWLAPILLLSILGLCVSYVMNQRVDWGSYIRQQAEKSPRFARLSEDQKQRALETQVKLAPYFAYFFGVLGTALFALILTLVYWGAFNLFAGAGLRFGTSFGIVSHAWLPLGISSLLIIVTLLMKQPGDVDPNHMLASSLGTFLGGDAPKWLEALANSFELFWIWVLILVAIGFSVANPRKVSTGKAMGIVFGIWVAWLLVKVCWAAAFS